LQPDHPKLTEEEINNTPATSGLSDDIIANDSQMLAYDDITKIVAKLLYDNPHAQLFVAGHSLGGALAAAVYGAMLYYNAETEMTDRLAAIIPLGSQELETKTLQTMPIRNSKVTTIELSTGYHLITSYFSSSTLEDAIIMITGIMEWYALSIPLLHNSQES
jgi:hypothetical protein